LFRKRRAASIATALQWNVARLCGVLLDNESRRLPDRFAMTDTLALQFEVIRTIAASLISVAIFLLWLVVISRQ
jgi:hypothetical protein